MNNNKRVCAWEHNPWRRQMKATRLYVFHFSYTWFRGVSTSFFFLWVSRYVILNAKKWHGDGASASISSWDSYINGYFFCRNVKIVSIRKITPLMMETTPFVIAKSLVRVRNARSHDCMMNTPDVRKSAVPNKL